MLVTAVFKRKGFVCCGVYTLNDVGEVTLYMLGGPSPDPPITR